MVEHWRDSSSHDRYRRVPPGALKLCSPLLGGGESASLGIAESVLAGRDSTGKTPAHFEQTSLRFNLRRYRHGRALAGLVVARWVSPNPSPVY